MFADRFALRDQSGDEAVAASRKSAAIYFNQRRSSETPLRETKTPSSPANENEGKSFSDLIPHPRDEAGLILLFDGEVRLARNNQQKATKETKTFVIFVCFCANETTTSTAQPVS